jgi:hypothetical protein
VPAAEVENVFDDTPAVRVLIGIQI